MNKLLLTVCCIIAISFQSKAQFDTIPNSGFEDWYLTANWNIAALGWQNNNGSIAAWNVVPDSVSHTGLLALKIQNISYRGVIWSGFPLSQHPLTLEGFMKNALNLGDTALIQIHIYSANTIVDSGYAEIYGGIGSNFLPFSVNISQNAASADSGVITLTGGNMYMSTVSFDDLSFSFPTAIEEGERCTWNVFPNPCTDVFTITGMNGAGEGPIVILRDITGKIVLEENDIVAPNRRVINIQSFSAGVYLLSITDGKKRSNHVVIKN